MAAIDAVYTWVDDAWPGYQASLRSCASDRHDLNPNRYRDNLQILKYSLRSLARFVPWIRHVYLVTCRPQVPVWLDPSHVQVIHHDMFMPVFDLPTFNSFAIVANLHRIDGLSQRFVYIEDDHLFGSMVSEDDLFDSAGQPRIYLRWRSTARPSKRHDRRISPWNRALAYSNHLLHERYGNRPRRAVNHGPLAIDIQSWRAMIACWPEAFRRTSGSRFRTTENVVPEHLYPHFLIAERRAIAMPLGRTRRVSAYQPVNNQLLLQRIGLARLAWQKPKFMCLNDDFGQRPNREVVQLVSRTLERWFPNPSPFEIDHRTSGAIAIGRQSTAT